MPGLYKDLDGRSTYLHTTGAYPNSGAQTEWVLAQAFKGLNVNARPKHEEMQMLETDRASLEHLAKALQREEMQIRLVEAAWASNLYREEARNNQGRNIDGRPCYTGANCANASIPCSTRLKINGSSDDFIMLKARK